MFAIYRDREVIARYFNGTGYVVRHEMYPHTHYIDGRMVTRQGHARLVGARQGLTDDAGFTYRRYRLPDTDPALTCPMCGSHDLTKPHWNGYVADATGCRDCGAQMLTEAATPGTDAHEYIKANHAA
jgi:hypothetical protein